MLPGVCSFLEVWNRRLNHSWSVDRIEIGGGGAELKFSNILRNGVLTILEQKLYPLVLTTLSFCDRKWTQALEAAVLMYSDTQARTHLATIACTIAKLGVLPLFQTQAKYTPKQSRSA